VKEVIEVREVKKHFLLFSLFFKIHMDNPSLDKMRHSLSHIMAEAVLSLWPGAKLTIGPAIDNGFYYDFDLEHNFTPEDLILIEKAMKKIIKENQPFEQFNLPINEALEKIKKSGNEYKLELAEELKAKGETELSFYRNVDASGAEKFSDMCAGPHLSSTGEVGAFKLDKTAGAYWRGDSNNKMLQRIYGLAFETEDELANYLSRREEAEKRDHRKLGRELDWFSFHEEAPGMPFFHPKGVIIYNELKNFWLEAQKEFDYDQVLCPSMLDVAIWKKSGHFDHYKDDMYFINADKEEGGKQFALRPMDCPGAILIYNNSLKSYRDLPLRYAEPGLITRKEKSGQLNGLLRVQQFVQDDAHMFITEDQIESEVKNVIALVDKVYQPFGLKYKAYLSTRPDDSMGEISLWDQAENSLKKILEEVYGADYGVKEKDGAFYGPKIDYQLEDCLGRTWQCATIQLDFQMPIKFDCAYIERDGNAKRPVMIHRTIMGSFERFMGILIEHYAGILPLWLAPVQVKVIPVGGAHVERANEVVRELKKANIRAAVSGEDETVGKKIRNAEKEKIPLMAVIGDREMEKGAAMIRFRGQKEQVEMTIADLIQEVKKRILEKM
jgi:threonyl-tRNA synthetase